MKFDTQVKTHLSWSPHAVHLFYINKSCECTSSCNNYIQFQISQKLAKKTWPPCNLWPNYDPPKWIMTKVVWNHKVTIRVTLHSIVTLEPPTSEPNMHYTSRWSWYHRLIYFLNQPIIDWIELTGMEYGAWHCCLCKAFQQWCDILLIACIHVKWSTQQRCGGGCSLPEEAQIYAAINRYR